MMDNREKMMNAMLNKVIKTFGFEFVGTIALAELVESGDYEGCKKLYLKLTK